MREEQDPPDLLCRTWTGDRGAGSVVVLHGSGQDEHSLLAFARAACPARTLVAVRGRFPWEGGFAFVRRSPGRALDGGDLADSAAALHRLLLRVHDEGGRPPVLLGYSNGAIAATAALLLDHRLTSGAILLRPLSPRPGHPLPPLEGCPVLLVSGADDRRRDPGDAPVLDGQLRAAGARTTWEALPAGHALTRADEDVVRGWLHDVDSAPDDTIPR